MVNMTTQLRLNFHGLISFQRYRKRTLSLSEEIWNGLLCIQPSE